MNFVLTGLLRPDGRPLSRLLVVGMPCLMSGPHDEQQTLCWLPYCKAATARGTVHAGGPALLDGTTHITPCCLPPSCKAAGKR